MTLASAVQLTQNKKHLHKILSRNLNIIYSRPDQSSIITESLKLLCIQCRQLIACRLRVSRVSNLPGSLGRAVDGVVTVDEIRMLLSNLVFQTLVVGEISFASISTNHPEAPRLLERRVPLDLSYIQSTHLKCDTEHSPQVLPRQWCELDSDLRASITLMWSMPLPIFSVAAG